jgi:hypothetical protein
MEEHGMRWFAACAILAFLAALCPGCASRLSSDERIEKALAPSSVPEPAMKAEPVSEAPAEKKEKAAPRSAPVAPPESKKEAEKPPVSAAPPEPKKEEAAVPPAKTMSPPSGVWLGLHVVVPNQDGLPLLKKLITDGLPPLGVNVLVLEVNYQFAYESHPELVQPGAAVITKDQAHELAELCKSKNIRLIPEFNCLGHQSGGNKGATLPLLEKYPELDETPQAPANNESIYCRSWCPLHPKVNEIVFAMIDDLIDAFQPDAFHVGMDEVFLIADPQCPRCKGQDPAVIFAKAVNDLHAHIVDEKHLTMLMWGDRLIDQRDTHYNWYESSQNGTAPAIDRIPKDIVICDWHYGKRTHYPSVVEFQEKGFRVWPASWNHEASAVALIEYARENATSRLLGHLCTSWVPVVEFTQALLKEGDQTKLSKNAVSAAEVLRACAALWAKPAR